MPQIIRVIQYGLGPIGGAMARHVTERAGLELVGGVDVDPRKAGKDLGEMIGRCRELRLRAGGNERQLRSDFAVLLTVQTMHVLYSQARRDWIPL